MHDPGSGRSRAIARKRGGQRNRPMHAGDPATVPAKVRTLGDVLAVLDYSLAEAMPLENSIQRGRLLIAICSTFIEAIKVGELEQRLTELERAILPNS